MTDTQAISFIGWFCSLELMGFLSRLYVLVGFGEDGPRLRVGVARIGFQLGALVLGLAALSAVSLRQNTQHC